MTDDSNYHFVDYQRRFPVCAHAVQLYVCTLCMHIHICVYICVVRKGITRSQIQICCGAISQKLAWFLHSPFRNESIKA